MVTGEWKGGKERVRQGGRGRSKKGWRRGRKGGRATCTLMVKYTCMQYCIHSLEF